jgi:hypothetical protein
MPGFKNIPAIEDDGTPHRTLDSFKIRISKLLPFRYQQKGVGARQAIIVVRGKFDA